MSEADAIAKSTRGPVTREWLVRDLCKLGVRPGMLLMAHVSLSGLGWVVGGAETVALSLLDTLGIPDPRTGKPIPAGAGTLLIPSFSGGNTNPIYWHHPPVPTDWCNTIRTETPPFDPGHTLTRGMGRVTEWFRSLPDVQRSIHPAVSWVGLGPLAAGVLAEHSLSFGLGEESPLGKCYQHGGSVLSLATQRTTILHLAEHRIEYPGKDYRRQGGAMLITGRREWVEYDDLEGDDSDFEKLRLDYLQHVAPGGGSWQAGAVGYGESRLFAVRPLVDFAVDWLSANRQ